MTTFDEIIKNTETACALCEREFSHPELIEVIKTDDDMKKQICLLKLDCVRNQEEADLLVFNLTNHHGIIREAASEKLNELMKREDCRGFFQTCEISDTILDAVIDMNPNICRMVIDVLPFINDKTSFFEKLFERALTVIDDAKTMNRRNKGYIYSKKVFKIFWYMEALCRLGYFEDFSKIKMILEKTVDFEDYTIREKAAKLVSIFDSTDIKMFRETLKNDENYFVRRFLNH